MNRKIKPDDIFLGAIAEYMRDACPVEGRAWMKYIEVTLKPGENIKRHKHRYHAVLYYPIDASAVVVEPKKGTIIYMPPGTYHEVPRVVESRRSLAMIIEEPKNAD